MINLKSLNIGLARERVNFLVKIFMEFELGGEFAMGQPKGGQTLSLLQG